MSSWSFTRRFCLIVSLCNFVVALVEAGLSYSIYIYDIPNHLLSNSEQARRNNSYHVCKKCIYEQFSLEYVIYDHFTLHAFRTYDPNQADFFYLPIIRDVDYRIALNSHKKKQRDPSEIEVALLNAIESHDFNEWHRVFNVTSEYWRRSNGSDHIIVMPAPVTNLRHQSNMRGFFHYMIQLNSPIFISVELSKTFIEEYPFCSTKKNIIMPYPLIDPDFYSTKLLNPSLRRDKLVFYLGGDHGSCVPVRNALNEISRNKQFSLQKGHRKREEGFQSAVFCPIPVGDSPSSKRMYDVIHYGCIPIVLSDDLVWAYSSAAGGLLDPSLFSIHLPQSIVLKTAAYLIEHYVTEPKDINGGALLPTRGESSSLFELLKKLAQEELLDGHRNETTSALSRRQLIERMTTTGQRANITSGRQSNRSKQQPKTIMSNRQNRKDSGVTVTIGRTNTLIRLLQSIAPADIEALQRGVRNVSQYYQFYAVNASLKHSGDVPIPLSIYKKPNGAALTSLDQLLGNRKKDGLRNIHRQCQEERSRPSHRYIGNYPCDKRRR